MHTRVLIYTTILLVIGIAPAPLRAQTYTVRADGRSHFRLHAHTTTEDFTGQTDRVEGVVILSPAAGAMKEETQARVAIDLASVDTGVAMRDRRMRERYLETDKYPKAIFLLRRILSPARMEFVPGQPTTMRVEGTLALHGVERPLTVDVVVTRLAHETISGQEFPVAALRVHTSFPIRLRDYSIRTPRFLFIKMSQTLKLDIDLYAEAPRPSRYGREGSASKR
jgi:polyisoprenoid-binding protein YceI